MIALYFLILKTGYTSLGVHLLGVRSWYSIPVMGDIAVQAL